MKENKEYFNVKTYYQKYYQDHKKEYRERKRKWVKENPGRVKVKKKPTNRSKYIESELKILYIMQYKKDLEGKKDNLTCTVQKKRVFCVDCLEYKTKVCPGWEACEYREETLELINHKKAEY